MYTKMPTFAFLLSELFPLDGFNCDVVSTPQLEYRLKCFYDTSHIRKTFHKDVSCTRMATFFFFGLIFP